MRTCKRCHVERDEHDFYANAHLGRINYICRYCKMEAARLSRQQNPRKRDSNKLPLLAPSPSMCWEGCAFWRECRYIVKENPKDATTGEFISPYCFPDSKFYHRYVAYANSPLRDTRKVKGETQNVQQEIEMGR